MVLTEVFLVSWRMPGLRVLVLGHGHNYIAPDFNNIFDSVLSGTTVAQVACVAIVAIANAYKGQCHRHRHHDEYE